MAEIQISGWQAVLEEAKQQATKDGLRTCQIFHVRPADATVIWGPHIGLRCKLGDEEHAVSFPDAAAVTAHLETNGIDPHDNQWWRW